MGMTQTSLESIEYMMEQAVSERVFPGGVLLAGRGNELKLFKTVGVTNLFSPKPVGPGTFFDLASLTKPLATTLAVMCLSGKKIVDLEAPVSMTIPELAHTDKMAVTWRHLLAHTSGLPDYRPYYRELLSMPAHLRKPGLHRLLVAEPLINPCGTKTVYSDIGFLLLQWALEKVTGVSLDKFVTENIYRSLSVSDLFFLPGGDTPSRTGIYAATERCPARGILDGVVHDENAYAIGGAAGHAGLFGTAEGVYRLLVRLCEEYTGSSSWFGPGIVRQFFTRSRDADRALGFDVPSPGASSSGKYFDQNYTVGHLGFTGTSFWMDPRHGEIIILLTNRVHPTRSNERIREFRPVIHDAVMSYIML